MLSRNHIVGLAHLCASLPSTPTPSTRNMDRYTDALAALKKDEVQFNSFIRSSFSEEAHILVRSHPCSTVPIVATPCCSRPAL